MPTTWDESIALNGKFGEYVTTARRSGDTWFVGTATKNARTMPINLNFLDHATTYNVTTFEDDGNEGITKKNTLNITSANQLTFNLLASGGAAAIIEPAKQDSALPQPVQDGKIDIISNHGTINVIASADTQINNVRVYALDGTILGENPTLALPASTGIVIVQVDTPKGRLTRKVLVK